MNLTPIVALIVAAAWMVLVVLVRSEYARHLQSNLFAARLEALTAHSMYAPKPEEMLLPDEIDALNRSRWD